MRLFFFGAAQTVTGSMFGLETKNGRLLVDCGMFQGRRREARERNSHLPSWAVDADAVLLTHAHIDHSGILPKLVSAGYEGPIYTTPATRDLCVHMLRDSARIQEGDAKYLNKKHEDDPDWEVIEPLYTEQDAVETLKRFATYHYWNSFEPIPGVRVTFYDAGHVLGSASALVEAEGRRILFSGDIGRRHLPILRDPEIPAQVDYLVMESTYGDREHGPIETVHEDLARIINLAVQRKSKVVIPSFALERTQEVVYALSELTTQKKIPPVPVFVDSPLATNLTMVFRNHPECYDYETLDYIEKGDPFGFDTLRFTESVEESIALNSMSGPMVIISASGMCEAGRVLHHLRNTIEDPKNFVVIVGYQAQHTLGRRIAERRPQVKIFGVMRDLNAQVEVLDGFSAHAGRSALIDYAKLAGPDIRRVFLVHGDPEPQAALAEALAKRNMDVVIPSQGQIETLD